MKPEDLQKWRHSHDYSQSQLAKALGVIPITISRWERGDREIPSFLYLALKCLKKKGPGIKPGRPFKKQKLKKRGREIMGNFNP
jgi:transcriptional regulator with XRE-family HTH domain